MAFDNIIMQSHNNGHRLWLKNVETVMIYVRKSQNHDIETSRDIHDNIAAVNIALYLTCWKYSRDSHKPSPICGFLLRASNHEI